MTVSSLTPVKHRLRVYNTELLQELVQPSKPVHFQEVREARGPLMLACAVSLLHNGFAGPQSLASAPFAGNKTSVLHS